MGLGVACPGPHPPAGSCPLPCPSLVTQQSGCPGTPWVVGGIGQGRDSPRDPPHLSSPTAPGEQRGPSSVLRAGGGWGPALLRLRSRKNWLRLWGGGGWLGAPIALQAPIAHRGAGGRVLPTRCTHLARCQELRLRPWVLGCLSPAAAAPSLSRHAPARPAPPAPPAHAAFAGGPAVGLSWAGIAPAGPPGLGQGHCGGQGGAWPSLPARLQIPGLTSPPGTAAAASCPAPTPGTSTGAGHARADGWPRWQGLHHPPHRQRLFVRELPAARPWLM